MKQPNIQPITNEPALFIKKNKTLVIADLHIGIESELREEGIHTSSKTHLMKDHLISLCQEYKPNDIILLGDIKHTIPATTIQERRDVKYFLEAINNFGKTHILPGNHDGNIKKISPPEIHIHPSDGIVLDEIGYVHGHRWPTKEVMQAKQIIIGHTHPTIMLTDRLEYKSYESCWLKGKTIKEKLQEKYPENNDPEILVIPAFNPLCGGAAANKEGITGPFGKIMDIPNSQVYLLDGSSLGKVKNIK